MLCFAPAPQTASSEVPSIAVVRKMESSLASLFMEANLPSLPLSWEISGESVEELQQQLISISMKLQSTREAAELHSKLNEAKICHLQGLLDAAMKERDEARMKCSALQEHLLQLSHPAPPSAAESPCSLLRSSLSCTSSSTQFSHQSPTSPTIDTNSFQGPKQKTGADAGVLIFEDDVHAKSLPHQDVQDIFALELNLDPSAVTLEDSQQQFSMDILNDDVGLDEDESLDLTDLQMDGNQSSNSSWDAHASNASIAGHTLISQTSCASSAASQSWGAVECPKVPATTCNEPHTLPSQHIFTMQPAHNPLSAPSLCNVIIPEVSRFANKALHSCAGTMQQKSTHLVEPFECVANVHDNALPEKRKLLQAVMQAGPLLQNLLLAGPLPEWRYPPPQLNTVDIPRVPMVPSSMLPHDHPPPPPLSTTINNHVPMMQSPSMSHTMSLGHANSALFADNRGRFGAASALPYINTAKAERNPYVGGRKLRKLTPPL